MSAHEDGRHQAEARKCCECSCIEAAGETDVEHGTEQKDPESRGETGCADGRDLLLGDALRSEHLRQGQDDEAADEADGGVGEAHQPHGGSSSRLGGGGHRHSVRQRVLFR